VNSTHLFERIVLKTFLVLSRSGFGYDLLEQHEQQRNLQRHSHILVLCSKPTSNGERASTMSTVSLLMMAV
jgi:hypothetical protein